MKKNKIIFIATDDYSFNIKDKPFPVKKIIPKWWKSIPKYSFGNKIELYPHANLTVKQCAPMLDSLSSGYVITLWTDVLVRQKDGVPHVTWNNDAAVFDIWSEKQVSHFEIPEGFNTTVFKFLNGWTIKTPPGWSCLITHPFGYQNIPIRSITGIVDTDILDTEINFPLFLKEGFEGVLEKGMPIAQIIPIKREPWESEYKLHDVGRHWLNCEKLKTKIYGYYSSIREKKQYD